MATGEFNGDGKLDVICVVSAAVSNLVVLTNNGNGTFTRSRKYSASGLPTAVTVADFNLDGRDDFVVVVDQTNSAAIWLGNGDGTFSQNATYPVGVRPRSVAVGDLNRDGLPDIVTGNDTQGTVTVLLNETYPKLTLSKTNNQVRFSWSTMATGFVLQVTSSLSPSNNWTTLTNLPVVVGNQNVVTNSMDGGVKFYRLAR